MASESITPDQNAIQISKANTLAQSLRELGRNERDIEEARLRKRQKREGRTADGGSASRTSSVAPGTPGSTAPEPEKAPTKKELKSKNAAAKAAELSNAASANRTSATFLNMFGKKKKYSWMSQSASGASTPNRPGLVTQGLPGTPGGGQGTAGAGLLSLTIEGRTRFGSWREDGDKGKGIQMRDLVMTLETDGLDSKALQSAYDKLDPAPATTRQDD